MDYNLFFLLSIIGTVISVTIWEKGKRLGPVPTLMYPPSLTEFLSHYRFIPWVVRGHGLSRNYSWDDQSLLETMGADHVLETVELELVETRLKQPLWNLTLGEFLARYQKEEMYMITPLVDSLMSQFPVFDFLVESNEFTAQRPMLWLSRGGTRSVIHQDSDNNEHCVFEGSKRILLFDSRYQLDTQPYDSFGFIDCDILRYSNQFSDTQEILNNNNNKEVYDMTEKQYNDILIEMTFNEYVDDKINRYNNKCIRGAYGAFAAGVDDPLDFPSRFTGYDYFMWYDVLLEAGDCIFIPKNWYHYVEGCTLCSRCLSAHIWFK